MDLFQYYNSVDCFIKSKPKRPNQRLLMQLDGSISLWSDLYV